MTSSTISLPVSCMETCAPIAVSQTGHFSTVAWCFRLSQLMVSAVSVLQICLQFGQTKLMAVPFRELVGGTFNSIGLRTAFILSAGAS